MSADEPKYNIFPHWIKRLPQPWQGLVIALVGLYLLIALVGGLWAVGEFFVALSGDAEDAHVAIRNTGFIFLAVMGAPLVIWRAVVAQGNLDRSKDRDYADLFTKAVEQLGATRDTGDREDRVTEPNIEVRLGAIYALERISHDSERDHIAVVETLCAYIRNNFRATGLRPKDTPFAHEPPRVDLQAAIKVLGRRSSDRLTFERQRKFRLDLRNSNLSFVNFSGGDFSAALFHFCRLEVADFSKAKLNGTQFDYSLLNFARFFDAEMRGTIFDNVVIEAGQNFGDFTFGKVEGISVCGANLTAIKSIGQTPKLIFGSRDTQLAERLNRLKSEHLELAESFHPLDEYDDENERGRLQAEVESSAFGHWFAYDTQDLALTEVRRKYWRRLGITGWPHDNS